MLTLEGIRAMGYLLDALKAEKTIRFSRLCERLRADESLASGAVRSAFEKGTEHTDLQEAAWQLKDLGIVRITNLDESLLDPDLYRLAWPEISEKFVANLQKSHPDFFDRTDRERRARPGRRVEFPLPRSGLSHPGQSGFRVADRCPQRQKRRDADTAAGHGERALRR
jgi:hypothetical protein